MKSFRFTKKFKPPRDRRITHSGTCWIRATCTAAALQRVEGMHLNLPPLSSVPESGQLGEITVPYTRCYRRVGSQWQPLYRLYYGSVHWITEVGEGPTPGTWYRLTDDLLHVHICGPCQQCTPDRT